MKDVLTAHNNGNVYATGDLQVDGNADLKINAPADAWGVASGTVFTPQGMVAGSQGSYGTAMTSNGYRNTSGKWTSLGLNNSVGAASIELLPTGTFYVRASSNWTTGSASAPPVQLTVSEDLTKVASDLQVDGKLNGLTFAGEAVPPSGAQIVRSGTNGYTYLGWLNTVSGATTNEPSRIYTNSGGSDSFVRYMTPANFRAKVIDGNYITAHNGASATPGFRFASSTSSGMYYNSSYLGLTFQGGWKLLCYKDYVRTGVKINNVDGTAALPAYSFQSDANTGMYRYNADQIGFAAGGYRRLNTGNTGTEVCGPNRGDSNKTWADLQLRVMSETSGGSDSTNSHVGIALWAQRPGIAPMMRVHKSAGEGVGFTNSANSAFIDVFAKGVVIPSASTLKRNIKTVQDDAVISLAEKWLMAEFDRQVGPLSVRIKPEAAVRQAALLEAGEELPPADTADYESVDHDCALDLCDGSPENPCPIIVNHRSEWGGIAEWWGEVAPQQVVFDEHGEATGIKLEQVAATALGAVGALSRRLTDSLDRIDALEERIAALES
jgi:hypothetical protein